MKRLLDSFFAHVAIAAVSAVILFAGLTNGFSLMNEPSWLSVAMGAVVVVLSLAQASWLCKPVYYRIKKELF